MASETMLVQHLDRLVTMDSDDRELADAYMASVAGDLEISEIVDQPNWVVPLHLERDLLEGRS